MEWGQLQSFIQLSVGLHAGYAVFSEASSKALRKNNRELKKMQRVMEVMTTIATENQFAGEKQSIALLLTGVLAPEISRNDERIRGLAKFNTTVRLLSIIICFIFSAILVYSSFSFDDDLNFWEIGLVLLGGSVVAVVAVIYHICISFAARSDVPRVLEELRNEHLAALRSFAPAAERLREGRG